MNLPQSESSIDELEARYKSLLQRGAQVERNKTMIEAELNARKRSLKDAMELAKKEGYNPDNLVEEIRRNKEILMVKLDLYQTELEAAEMAMKPMLQEIQKG